MSLLIYLFDNPLVIQTTSADFTMHRLTTESESTPSPNIELVLQTSRSIVFIKMGLIAILRILKYPRIQQAIFCFFFNDECATFKFFINVLSKHMTIKNLNPNKHIRRSPRLFHTDSHLHELRTISNCTRE